MKMKIKNGSKEERLRPEKDLTQKGKRNADQHAKRKMNNENWVKIETLMR